MNETSKALAAIAKATGEMGEKECTVLMNGIPVKVMVPDQFCFETAVSSPRLSRLGVLKSKPVATGAN